MLNLSENEFYLYENKNLRSLMQVLYRNIVVVLNHEAYSSYFFQKCSIYIFISQQIECNTAF